MERIRYKKTGKTGRCDSRISLRLRNGPVYAQTKKGGPCRPPFENMRKTAIYWSRKLRILRLRDGCLSLRSAFASI